MTDPDDGFLNRWSRRKLENEKAAATVEAEPVPQIPEAPPEALPETMDDQVPLDLPDIDTLDKDSDFTVFMQAGVPDELKNLALRALWRSDPVLANLDGLNDYDEDFGSILKVGAEFMRKLALEEQENGPGEGFRPREEPPDPETPDSGDPENTEEIIVNRDAAEGAAETEHDEAPDENRDEATEEEGDISGEPS